MIRVAAAVIRKEGRILLARRAPHKSQAGLWEFPGGKVEPGETVAQCLVRELREELGLAVVVGRELALSTFKYEHGEIELVAHECACDAPEVKASTDHDRWEWVEPANLLDYDLAPADVPIASRLAR